MVPLFCFVQSSKKKKTPESYQQEGFNKNKIVFLQPNLSIEYKNIISNK